MITIQSSNVYILTEESVYNAQPVADISTSEAATFEIISGDPHGYLYIDPATGNVTLSATGVEAINTDYPENLELEINQIVFTIEATSISDASTDSEELTVGVIRVHDEEPQIVEEIITPLYVDDTTSGFRLLEIRTAYDSTFTVMVNADKATVLYSNIGRVTLTTAGTTYIRDLISSGAPDPKFEFSLIIVDDLNQKEIIQEYSLDILAGSAQTNIPTKNILDLVGEHLGEDLGTSLADINIELFEIIKQRDLVLQESVSINSQAYTNTANISELRDTVNELNLRINNKIDAVRQLIDNLTNAVKSEFSQGLYTELASSLDQMQNFHLIMQDQFNALTATTLKNRGDIEAYKDFLVRYIHHEDDRVQSEASTARNVMQVYLEGLISSLRTEYETFRDVTYYNEVTSLQNQIDINAAALVTQAGGLGDVNATLILHDARIQVLELFKTEIDNATLEDWGDPGAWAFLGSALSYNSGAVLTHSASALTVSGGSGNIAITGTYFGNSGLECRGSIFTGTATTAQYADLAEYYTVKEKIQPGTLVDFTEEGLIEIEPAKGRCDPMGIITTKPGFILNTPEDTSGMDAVALIGRVPLLVVNIEEAKRGSYVYQDIAHPTLGRIQDNKSGQLYILGRVINIYEGYVEIKVG